MKSLCGRKRLIWGRIKRVSSLHNRMYSHASVVSMVTSQSLASSSAGRGQSWSTAERLGELFLLIKVTKSCFRCFNPELMAAVSVCVVLTDVGDTFTHIWCLQADSIRPLPHRVWTQHEAHRMTNVSADSFRSKLSWDPESNQKWSVQRDLWHVLRSEVQPEPEIHDARWWKSSFFQ